MYQIIEEKYDENNNIIYHKFSNGYEEWYKWHSAIIGQKLQKKNIKK